MNITPETYISVPHQDLQAFISQAGQTVGLPAEKAELLAGLLVGNDLRGVFSHGTRQMATCARLMRDGQLNNRPQVQTAQETPASLLVDGDGGLGYFPAHQGTLALIEKAKAQGIAILLTRNPKRNTELRRDLTFSGPMGNDSTAKGLTASFTGCPE